MITRRADLGFRLAPRPSARSRASAHRTAQKPINPDGGEAPKVFARIDRRDLVRLDRVAEARGVRGSQVIRAAVEALLEREELLTA